MKLKYMAIFIAIVLIAFFIYQIFILTGWNPKRNDTPSKSSRLTQKQKDLMPSPSLHFVQGQAKEKQRQAKEDVNLPWSDFVYPTQVDIRNPFQQKVTQVEEGREENKPPSFVLLTGVLYSERNPIAIFTDKEGNSYLVREKDTILDYTVKRILKRSVILRRSNTDVEFKVFEEERRSN